MLCPRCNQRKARRECPALGCAICTVCCGTERLVSIQCPSDCAYLAAAREHPAAVVRRQQERDVARLLPTIQHLTERQYQLFFLLQTVVTRHTPDGFTRLVDRDVAEAAGALAATCETATRGVIYEHVPQGRQAQSLAAAMKALLAQAGEQGAKVHDRDAAVIFRAIERGARGSGTPQDGETSYLELMTRMLRITSRGSAPRIGAPSASSLIIP